MCNRCGDSWQQRSIWQSMRAVLEKGVLSEGNRTWKLHCVASTFASRCLPHLLYYTWSLYLMLDSAFGFLEARCAHETQHHLHSVSGGWQGSHFCIFGVQLLCIPAAPLVDCQKLAFLFNGIIFLPFFFLLSSCFSIKKMYVSFKMFLKHIWVHCKYYCCCINQKKNQII